MGVSLKDMLARETPAARARIAARTEELVAEEMSLRALRKAAGKTQAAIAAQLGLKQENVSRIEQRGDMLLSTLARYVQAVGGELRLSAHIGGKEVSLAGFVEAGATEKRKPVARAASPKRVSAIAGTERGTARPKRRPRAQAV